MFSFFYPSEFPHILAIEQNCFQSVDYLLQATAEQKEKEDPRAKRRKKELTSFASLFSSRSSTESDEENM